MVTKFLGKHPEVPTITADVTRQLDFMLTSPLHDADTIVGVNWRQTANPLIDWKSFRLFSTDSVGTLVSIGEWFNAQVEKSTV